MQEWQQAGTLHLDNQVLDGEHRGVDFAGSCSAAMHACKGEEAPELPMRRMVMRGLSRWLEKS